MTPILLRLLERRLAGRVPASRLAPLLGDLLEDYHDRRANHPGWRGWIAAHIWLARECLSISSAYRAQPSEPYRYPRRLATVLDDLRQDVRDARRTFVRHPGFTVTAILTLMLGIGANTAIFSVVHAILLRPLPYKDSHRLVELVGRRPAPGDRGLWEEGPALDLGTLALFRSHARTLSHVGVHDRITMTLTSGDGREPVQLVGHRVSASFLPMLGVPPRMGRLFTQGEEQAGADAVVILGYAAWQREFGGDPRILGRAVSLGDRKYSVVGVMDRGFQFPDALTQFWIPFVLPAGGPEARARLTVTARLADGISTEAAAAELAAILSRLPRPDTGPRPDAGPRPDPASRSDMAPRRDAGPRPDAPPRSDTAPRRDAGPRPDATPQSDAAPRRDAGPRPDTTPRSDAAPRRDAGPRPDAPPRSDVAPRRDAGPRPDATPRSDKAPNGAPGDAVGGAPRRPPGPGFVPGPTDFQVVRVQDRLVAPIRPALVVLAAAVGIVLLIACVNVANLLLVTGAARQREMAVRLALGAGRGRLLRQTLTESVLLALIGGAAGTALAFGAVPLLRALGTSLPRPDLQAGVHIPRLDEVGIDAPVLIFTAALSVLTGILFGLAPALRRLRAPLVDTLRTGSTAPAGGLHLRHGLRLQGLLVIAEIAMAVMLFISGGLLIHSFVKLTRVDPGYDATHVITFRPSLATDRDPIARLEAFEALTARLRAMPGVVEAGYTGTLPTMLDRGFMPLRRTPAPPGPPGSPASPGSPGRGGAPATSASGPPPDRASPRYVSQHYLRSMGVPIVAGRGFAEEDRAGQAPVMLVNEAVVRSGVLGPNPLGMPVYALGRQPWTIVGIVKDVRQLGLDRAPVPEFFIDFRQIPGYPFPESGPYFTVRTAGPPTPMIAAIRGALRELDSRAMLTSVDSMDAIVSNSVARPRLYAVLVGVFATVAMMLAAIGIYGVMAFAVSQRTHEMGIRLALGARPRAVMGLVLRHSAVLIAIGLIAGLAGAAAATRVLEGLLFGLAPFDAATVIAASLTFAAVAALASWIPARRATRIEPVVALRGE